MIRITTARNKLGIPVEWTDYPDREVGEVPAVMALRFDAQLAALKIADLSLGVKRWTEAAFRARRFNAQATAKWIEIVGTEPKADDWEPSAEMAEAMELWVAEQPDYLLTQQLGIWTAINLGGGRMTLLDVLSLADRDVEDIAEPPPFLEDEPEGDEGKA